MDKQDGGRHIMVVSRVQILERGVLDIILDPADVQRHIGEFLLHSKSVLEDFAGIFALPCLENQGPVHGFPPSPPPPVNLAQAHVSTSLERLLAVSILPQFGTTVCRTIGKLLVQQITRAW